MANLNFLNVVCDDIGGKKISKKNKKIKKFKKEFKNKCLRGI